MCFGVLNRFVKLHIDCVSVCTAYLDCILLNESGFGKNCKLSTLSILESACQQYKLVLTCNIWPQLVCSILFKFHRNEFLIILRGGMIRAYNILLSYFSPTLIMFIVLTVFLTAGGGTLTPRRVFTTLSLLGFMRRTTLRFFVRSMFMISEGKVALKRIKVK